MFCYNVFTYAVDQNPYGEAQVLMVLQAENDGWKSDDVLALKAALCGSEELLASALWSCARSRRQGRPVLRVLMAGVALNNSLRSGGRL